MLTTLDVRYPLAWVCAGSRSGSGPAPRWCWGTSRPRPGGTPAGRAAASAAGKLISFFWYRYKQKWMHYNANASHFQSIICSVCWFSRYYNNNKDWNIRSVVSCCFCCNCFIYIQRMMERRINQTVDWCRLYCNRMLLKLIFQAAGGQEAGPWVGYKHGILSFSLSTSVMDGSKCTEFNPLQAGQS